ncbi:hypothetical protein BJP36_42050 [Moorena producens JHB]|uniref:Uncharacterized protein n=1 Tax=Moorena producens (strain JHB) TaxID=1454205 RepID=A0A9Q9UVL4_MOOP1|nr:hypothetical protein [Moorena producens]WAN68944.1 hypothetical protein BJP36_42050 [Moorena producens JHB]
MIICPPYTTRCAIAFVGWAKVDNNCTNGETMIICPPYTTTSRQ